jgi:hypothetical protein
MTATRLTSRIDSAECGVSSRAHGPLGVPRPPARLGTAYPDRVLRIYVHHYIGGAAAPGTPPGDPSRRATGPSRSQREDGAATRCAGWSHSRVRVRGMNAAGVCEPFRLPAALECAGLRSTYLLWSAAGTPLRPSRDAIRTDLTRGQLGRGRRSRESLTPTSSSGSIQSPHASGLLLLLPAFLFSPPLRLVDQFGLGLDHLLVRAGLVTPQPLPASPPPFPPPLRHPHLRADPRYRARSQVSL